MAGENCRSGCRTRDHATYAQCLRAANTGVNLQVPAYRKSQWDSDVEYYRSAREEGLQPDSTRREDVDVAKAFADQTGVAYDAGDKTSTLLKAKGLD